MTTTSTYHSEMLGSLNQYGIMAVMLEFHPRLEGEESTLMASLRGTQPQLVTDHIWTVISFHSEKIKPW